MPHSKRRRAHNTLGLPRLGRRNATAPRAAFCRTCECCVCACCVPLILHRYCYCVNGAPYQNSCYKGISDDYERSAKPFIFTEFGCLQGRHFDQVARCWRWGGVKWLTL
jgi:hypothetical protein